MRVKITLPLPPDPNMGGLRRCSRGFAHVHELSTKSEPADSSTVRHFARKYTMKRESSILNPPAPVPITVIQPTRGLASLQLRAVWQYRELLGFLAWRDVKVRYKQTALGVAWIVLQPLLSTVVFTVIFGMLLQVPSDGAPYALYALAALVPWQYFSGSLTRVGTSLVNSANLISKVYFPRLIIPLSGVISTLVDFAVGFGVLAVLIFVYRVPLTAKVVTLPLFLLLAVVTALGFGLWLSALNVKYRDVNYLIPFLLQIWMYATPVVYGTALDPRAVPVDHSAQPDDGRGRGVPLGAAGGRARQPPPAGDADRRLGHHLADRARHGGRLLPLDGADVRGCHLITDGKLKIENRRLRIHPQMACLRL